MLVVNAPVEGLPAWHEAVYPAHELIEISSVGVEGDRTCRHILSRAGTGWDQPSIRERELRVGVHNEPCLGAVFGGVLADLGTDRVYEVILDRAVFLDRFDVTPGQVVRDPLDPEIVEPDTGVGGAAGEGVVDTEGRLHILGGGGERREDEDGQDKREENSHGASRAAGIGPGPHREKNEKSSYRGDTFCLRCSG